MEGNPVEGKIVIAFTWPEPHFSGAGTPNFIEAHKMGWLTGDTSEKSDENGIARFKKLTILGSNSKFVYIFFTCDGVTISSWQKQKPDIYNLYSLNYYIPPIKIETQVASLEIIKQPSSTIVEGIVLDL